MGTTAPAGAETPSGGRPRITLVLDPRFSGGTPAAVAEEVRALAGHVDLRVCGIETRMFRGRDINPRLQAALDDHGLALEWNPPVIRGDVVVFHNPSCLKFDTTLAVRISCADAFVVTHENLLRPNGTESFDVGGCLALIEQAVVARKLMLAPVSAHNRRGVERWLGRTEAPRWSIAPFDWTNICAFPLRPPARAPRDRRGRHSRPGFEKFPPLETMLAHFPPRAEHCAILGGDAYLRDPKSLPRHWRVLRFGEVEVEHFLETIDFFVYFTHPLWRESFGRVIAEAIAAGKLVITDPGSAETFGEGVIASDGTNVDALIERFVAEPDSYAEAVRRAQAGLQRFAPDRFRGRLLAALAGGIPECGEPGGVVARDNAVL